MRPAIHALIVDDEPLARANLLHALKDIEGWMVDAECASAAQARRAVEDHPPDVVFLDIQMPRENGLEFARALTELAPAPIIVFVTAFESFAVRAFELHALDYLLKPFDDARLRQTLARAEELLELRAGASYAGAVRGYLADDAQSRAAPPGPFLSRLSVRSVGRIEAVPVKELLWVKAAGNYVELHLPGRILLHRITLSHLASRLDPAIFMRVHRGALVRREECEALSVEGDAVYSLRLRGGTVVPVSERYVEEVRAQLSPC